MSALTTFFENARRNPEESRIQQAAAKIYQGGAIGVVIGTGYATPLVIATAGMQFIGVATETNDNTNGTPGTINHGAPGSGLSSFVRFLREGCFQFNQSGLTQAAVGRQLYFSDDNTVSLTVSQIPAGICVTVDEQNSKAWVDIGNAVMPVSRNGLQVLSGSTDAIPPRIPGVYVVTTAGVDAMTLGAPTATTDDGLVITVTSSTSNAHTITATGLLQTGTASVNVATFAAQKGAGVTLMAYQGKWQVLSSVGITFS